MCGICGFSKYTQQQGTSDLLKTMVQKIQHRGPDNYGFYENENIALGHARLSIIDLTEKANQPFVNDEKYIIVYNGETYNFLELRIELEELGISFQTNSDTEVVLKGYIHFGVHFFKKMNGMFALAIYDLEHKKLILARDRFGIKPLFYTVKNEELIFGSEIKTITSYTKEKEFDQSVLSEFLYFGNALGTKTVYNKIVQVPPGSYLEYSCSNKKFEIHHYWKIEDIILQKGVDLAKAKRSFLHLFENSVKRHLVSDVPVGLFLSGGVDSSLIAHYAIKHAVGNLTAYTASFEYDKGINEVEVAKKFSKERGIRHEEIHISAASLPDVVEKMVYHHDSPFSDAANIPLYLMSKQVAGKHKVILQGDGGDEFWGGYRRYNLLAERNSWNKYAKLKFLLPILPFSALKKERLVRILDIFGMQDEGERMGRLLTSERPSHKIENVFTANYKKQVLAQDPFQIYKEMNSRFKKLDAVQKMLFTDTQIILPNIFLEKVDRSTMASSVEVRVPFLDNNLTDFALGLPASLKLLGGKQKGFLNAAIKDVLPDYIVNKKKVGFSVPYENWIKGPLKNMFFDYLNSDFIKKQEIYNLQEVERCFRLHEQGVADKGFLLWKILNLNIWLTKNNIDL